MKIARFSPARGRWSTPQPPPLALLLFPSQYQHQQVSPRTASQAPARPLSMKRRRRVAAVPLARVAKIGPYHSTMGSLTRASMNLGDAQTTPSNDKEHLARCSLPLSMPCMRARTARPGGRKRHGQYSSFCPVLYLGRRMRPDPSHHPSPLRSSSDHPAALAPYGVASLSSLPPRPQPCDAPSCRYCTSMIASPSPHATPPQRSLSRPAHTRGTRINPCQTDRQRDGNHSERRARHAVRELVACPLRSPPSRPVAPQPVLYVLRGVS